MPVLAALHEARARRRGAVTTVGHDGLVTSATRPVRPASTSRPESKGARSPLRHWPWVVLTVALLGLLATGWSAAGWYPQTFSPACPEPECLSRARTAIALHWAGTSALTLLLLAGLVALVRSRPTAPSETAARLSPTWHGTVVGMVLLVLVTGTLLPTALVGIFSPPLGIAVVLTKWLLLTWLLERMHLAARPATGPRRRATQSLVIAGTIVALEVLLPLVSPFPAVSGGMLQLALVQAGVGLALTAAGASTDRAPHGDTLRERRLGLVAAGVVLVLVGVVAVIGLDLGHASASRFVDDLGGLTRPW